MKKRNRFLVGALAVSLAAVSTFGLVGCNQPDDPGNANGGGGIFGSGGSSSSINYLSAHDLSAIGGISLLNADFSSPSVLSASEISLASAQANPQPSVSDDEQAKIFGNLALAQNILAGGVVKSEVGESDKAGYQYYYTISASNISGEDKVYSFYYNQTEQVDDDKDQDEQEFRLDGIVILDGVEYKLIGEKEIEQDEEEVSFSISIDNNNRVEIEQSKENGEVEFEYTAYQNGKKVFETEVEYHVSANGNVSLEFETFDKANNLNQEYKFEFFSQNGEQFAKIKVENGNSVETKAVVKITANPDGSFSYQLVNPNPAPQNPQPANQIA